MTQRLPTPGGDDGDWGDILNGFLSVSLASDGTLSAATVGTTQLQNNAVTNGQLDTPTQSAVSKANASVQTINSKSPVNGAVSLSASDVNAIPTSQLGATNGVATLGGSSTLTTSQLPDLSSTYALMTSVGYTPEQYGAVGDGVTDDTTAFTAAWNAAKTAAASGIGRLKLSKNYLISSIPTARAGMLIEGGLSAPTYGSSAMNRPRITLSSSFTGAAALMCDETIGGFITVAGVNWDGSALGYSSSQIGWYVPGGGSSDPNWIVKDTQFYDFGGGCIKLGSTSPIVVSCDNVSAFYGQAGDGWNINVTDSDFFKCTGFGSQYGWNIKGAPASKFVECRSEHNSLAGWYLDSTIVTTSIIFMGCATDQNDQDGVLVNAATYGYTEGGSIKFIGCSWGRDGNNNGAGSTTYAGMRLTNNTVPIHIVGSDVAATRGDSTGYGPAYGVIATGNTAPITISGGTYGGTVAPVSNTSGIALVMSPDVQQYTRSSSGETITYATTVGSPWSADGPEQLASGEAIYARAFSTGNQALTSQTLFLSYFTASKTELCGHVRTGVAGTAAGSPTFCGIAVYSVAINGNLAQVATTGNLSGTLWSSTYASFTSAFTTSFTKIAGQRYAVGFLFNGTTPPTVASNTIGQDTGIQPFIAGQISTETNLATTSFVVGSISSANVRPYAALIP